MATETTTEEADLLTRSSKKVKIGDTSDTGGSKGGISYIDSLMGAPMAIEEDNEENLDTEVISDDDEDDCDDSDCPVIKLSVEEKKRIRAPWKQALIIKLLGRKVGYMFLRQRLENMWKLRGDFTLTDLGNDFYLIKLANADDRAHVLFGGPWMVADHYLTIRTWHPNFDPLEATIDKVAVWVRLPDLALEYYDNSVLWKIGEKIGKTLKVDRNTSVGMRGNFARMCVEVDLTKPLLAKFQMRRRVRRIMYEGLHLVCFHCGQYGHKQEMCPHILHVDQDATSKEKITEENTAPIVRPEVIESFGNWMIAERKQRRPSRRMATEGTVAAGKGRGQNKKLGDAPLMAIKEGRIKVAKRYDALRDFNGETEKEGLEDSIGEDKMESLPGGVNEEKEERSNKGKEIDRAGRLVGQTRQRAGGGPSESRAGRMAMSTGPSENANGRGIVMLKSKSVGLAMDTSGKQKEKVGEINLNAERRRTQHTRTDGSTSTLIIMPQNISDIEMSRVGVTASHRPTRRSRSPEPPDEINWMDEGNEKVEDIKQMEEQVSPTEDNMIEGGVDLENAHIEGEIL